jgi:AhpD family alkylhydroperoxidase
MERITYQDIPKGMFEKLMEVENLISESQIEIELLELIRLRIAQINGCAYCVDMHHKELKHLGETDLRLSSLSVWQETPYFSEKEHAVLLFSENLTQIIGNTISDEIVGILSNFFSKQQIAYLSLAVSQINTWTRLMKTFQFTPGNYQVKKIA